VTPARDPVRLGPASAVLVDHDAGFRLALRRFLEGTGEFHVVEEAADGATGVQVAVVHQPDVVLLDVELPQLGGLEALAHLGELCPETLVVMLTATPSSAQLDAALHGGAVGVIRKGSSMAGIVAQLRGLLELVPMPQIEIEGVH
jgi:DNA-binding NarL/FixJ family response regulator